MERWCNINGKKGLLRKTEGFRIIELRVYNIFSVDAFLFFAVGIINFSMFGRFRYLAPCITTALCKMLKYFPAGSMCKISGMLAFTEIKIKIIVFRRYSENIAASFRIVICHLEDRRRPAGPAIIFFY